MTPKKQPEVRDAGQVIRDYYEGGTEEAAFREDGTEPVSSVRDSHCSTTGRSPVLSGGDVEAADESDPTPDQDIVEEIGKAVGINYEDTEPLKFGEKVAGRDQRRWELDPASSEDYEERAGNRQQASSLPAQAASPQDAGKAKRKPTGAAGSRKGQARRSKRS